MTHKERFLAACKGEKTDRPPVWMMRQAGRYLPEYRELRSQHSFLEMCKKPEVACEVTLQPIRRYGMDAAILFSDILTLLEPFGLALQFDDGKGPSFSNPIRSMADIEKLAPFQSKEGVGFVAEAIALIKKGLGDDTALIGFSGAPLTLAIYSIEGQLTKEHRHFKKLLFSDPSAIGRYLDLLADQIIDYYHMQADAGVDALQLFDTWGATVDPDTYAKFVHPSHCKIIEALKPRGLPIVLFVKGGAPFMDQIVQTGADVIGLDWTLNLGEVAERYGNQVSFQGNLDPTVLLSPPDRVAQYVKPILEAGRKARGHVFNLGHGILPPTDPESARAMIRCVQEFRY